MSQYIDEIEKISYYRERIMQELTRLGVYPDTIAVSEWLEDFDAKLALFTHRYVSTGDNFDTEEFNEAFELIAADLKILYKLVYQLSIEKYKELKEYVDGHLAELQAMAKKYEYKTKFEIDSTSLGDTVFFQANGFDVTQDNSTARVNLGSIEVSNGSQLACIFEADNVADENVVFSFNGKNCSPYSLNRDFFTVPGEIKKNTYTYEVPDGETINSAHVMNVAGLAPSSSNKYIIYAGKDQVATTYDYYNKVEGTPLTFTDAGRVTFYVLNGSFINFDFSETPLSQNFTGTSIANLDTYQKITFEYPLGFSFDFITDGDIYATKGEGVIQDDKLYYPNGDNVRDFYIEEHLMENKTTYDNVTVTVSNLKDNAALVINAIAIKELCASEVSDI